MPKVPTDPLRGTVRPGQAHLLPSAQALGQKNTKTKQTKGSGNLENKCSLKPGVWHGILALQRAALRVAGGSWTHREVSPMGSQGAAASTAVSTMSTERSKHMCEHRLSLCGKGPPYWRQSLGFPGVWSALPRATAPACLRSRCDPGLKVTKTLLGAECVVCVGFMCGGAPPDTQGEAGRRLYCTR